MSLTFVKLLVCASHARFCLRDHEGQYTRYCDHQYMVMKMKKEKPSIAEAQHSTDPTYLMPWKLSFIISTSLSSIRVVLTKTMFSSFNFSHFPSELWSTTIYVQIHLWWVRKAERSCNSLNKQNTHNMSIVYVVYYGTTNRSQSIFLFKKNQNYLNSGQQACQISYTRYTSSLNKSSCCLMMSP